VINLIIAYNQDARPLERTGRSVLTTQRIEYDMRDHYINLVKPRRDRSPVVLRPAWPSLRSSS
jgi:hypothetical protein